MQINFSHQYHKLHGQKTAQLLKIILLDRCLLTDEFIEFDTAYPGGHYPLLPGTYLLLVFLGDQFIPFTTVRPFTDEKCKYYSDNIGKTFNIAVKKEPNQ